MLDRPFLLKPYHCIQWLENKGNMTFDTSLTPMYGVHRAVAGDLDGDGDLDIVAVSLLHGRISRNESNRDLTPSSC